MRVAREREMGVPWVVVGCGTHAVVALLNEFGGVCEREREGERADELEE
jgi:hypothetical protein